ncbi:hypothetical protein SAMN05216567_10152 [Variovorax sp. OK605]|uniref:hypothetical protein n=1 Tax=Variovorax sp. OK605 TaxID=1855317 RepID=UPI0008E14A47|nr:hypothetical protein [Variovorax sp. OK605]SFO51844.1 hypothetical protein SAMN05216567_10152 [Variovorax sp. OK605]
MFFAEVTFLMRNGLRLKPAERDPPLRVTVMIRESDREKNNSSRNLVEAMLFEHWGVPQARSAGLIVDPQMLPFKGPGFLLTGTELDCQRIDEKLRIFEHRQVWLVVPVAR